MSISGPNRGRWNDLPLGHVHPGFGRHAEWLIALQEHFGNKRVAHHNFEPPEDWTLQAWARGHPSLGHGSMRRDLKKQAARKLGITPRRLDYLLRRTLRGGLASRRKVWAYLDRVLKKTSGK